MKHYNFISCEEFTPEATLHVNIHAVIKDEQAKACVEGWIKDMVQGEPILFKGTALWRTANYKVFFDIDPCEIVVSKKTSSCSVVEVTK